MCNMNLCEECLLEQFELNTATETEIGKQLVEMTLARERLNGPGPLSGRPE